MCLSLHDSVNVTTIDYQTSEAIPEQNAIYSFHKLNDSLLALDFQRQGGFE